MLASSVWVLLLAGAGLAIFLSYFSREESLTSPAQNICMILSGAFFGIASGYPLALLLGKRTSSESSS